MAKFCANCGAQLEDDARFCGECGTPVEDGAPLTSDADTTPTPPETNPDIPQNPAAADPVIGEAPATGAAAPSEAELPPVFAEAAAPREKKPLPKWALPAGIAAAAVIVLLIALSFILKGINSPENTAEKFLSALNEGDFNALSKVAAPADEDVVFTEESTAPLFALYQTSIAFRKSLEQTLEEDVDLIEDGDDPNEGNLVDLMPEKRFLHTGYTVVIETCDADLSSNLLCTVDLGNGQTVSLTEDDSWSEKWADVYGKDTDVAVWSSGKAYDLLPGLYELSGSVTTSFGDTFEATATMEVSDVYGTYGELNFAYTSLNVYNDSALDAELLIGGEAYCTVPSYSDCIIAPILAETEVEARVDAGGGEPMTETFSAGEGYHYLSFMLCEIEVNNSHDVPIRVYRDDELLDEVPAQSYKTFSGLPSSTELVLQVYDDGILAPYTYVCESEYDYLYPEFSLSEESETEIQAVITAHVNEAFGLFNSRDSEALGNLTPTELSASLQTMLTALSEMALEEYGFDYTMQLTLQEPVELDYLIMGTTEDGLPLLRLYYDIDVDYLAQYTLADGSTDEDSSSDTLYVGFTLRHADAGWELVGEMANH